MNRKNNNNYDNDGIYISIKKVNNKDDNSYNNNRKDKFSMLYLGRIIINFVIKLL